MPTNRAVRLHSYGGPAATTLDDVAVPHPTAQQVLVRAAAAGMNPFDRKVRDGDLRDAFPLELPVTLGSEVAGRVEAIGDGVTNVAVGDRVVAWTGGQGAYANVVALDAASVARIPTELSDVVAAAIPVAGLTASQALFEHGHLTGGRTVLIHGASGGVGSFAVQLAARAGATVIATASAANLDYVRELGAAQAVDHADTAAFASITGVDLVLDLAGRGLELLWPTLKPGGHLVSTVAFDVGGRAPGGLTAEGIQMHPDVPGLEALVGRVASGELRAVVGRTVPFGDAVAAIDALGAGGVGKTVLVVG